MRELRRFLLLISAAVFAFALGAHAQDDAPSLGDVARQARQQKQQKEAQDKDVQDKDTQTKDASAKEAPSKDAPSKDAPSKDVPSKDVPSKDVPSKDKAAAGTDAQPLKVRHVITNDEIPEHIGPTRTLPGSQTPSPTYQQPTYSEGKAPAEYWKAQITAQKNAIANLKANIDSLSASIQYAGANCVSGCVQWNERQKQKQDQVDAMKIQLEEQQKRLEDMQETARRQGYGSSVYDP
jgi:hypothetical protein